MPRYLRREVPGRLRADGRRARAARPRRPAGDPRRLPRGRRRGGRDLPAPLLRQPGARAGRARARARALAGGVGRRVAPDQPRVARVRADEHRPCCRPTCSRWPSATSAGSPTGSSDGGFDGQLYVMQSNCGVDSVEKTKEIPITMVESGPASGFWGAAELGRLLGEPNVLALDIGGTTAKCSLIEGGHVKIVSDYWIERDRLSAGYPIQVPVVDVVEIGQGGGSIAWVDDFAQAARRPAVGRRDARARPPTAAAATARRRPTPTSRSAASTRATSAAARSRPTWTRSTRALGAIAQQLGDRPRRGGARRRAHRQQQHDQRAEARLGEPRLRPARLHARRLRRRRRHARRRARSRARDPARW